MFKFKQFSVRDDQSTMKVGTDAVLLGAWVDVGKAKTILDIGTGSGVIALMMAQRAGSSAHIDAIEPDHVSAQQASGNFKSSPWAAKISVHNTTIQEYHHAPHDLIVSNPPFFSKSLLPPSAGRQNARHAETLSFDDLLTSIKRLLAPEGRFAVVLPFAEGNVFLETAGRYEFKCHRTMAFYTRAGKPQERWLMEFSAKGKTQVKDAGTVILYGDGDKWSEDYRHLTGDYYL